MSAAAVPPGFRSGMVEITPTMAQKAIDDGNTNRAEKPRAIRKYAGDMLAVPTRWDSYNGETIKFHDGRLVDGLQRMSAVVLAGQTRPDIVVPFLVVNGVTENAIMTVDSGVSRSFADWLKIDQGVVLSGLVASVTNRMYQWDVEGIHAGRMWGSASYPQLAEYFGKPGDGHFDEIMGATAESDSRDIRLMMTSSVYVTSRVILRRIDEDQANDFLRQVVTGAVSSPDSPVLPLRGRLMADRMYRGRRGGQGKNTIVYPASEVARALVCSTWNIWRDGRIVKKIPLPKGDLQKNYPMPR